MSEASGIPRPIVEQAFGSVTTGGNLLLAYSSLPPGTDRATKFIGINKTDKDVQISFNSGGIYHAFVETGGKLVLDNVRLTDSLYIKALSGNATSGTFYLTLTIPGN